MTSTPSHLAAPFALTTTERGRMAVRLIAEHAALRRDEHGPGGTGDRLEHWESITSFGDYTITVRCDYKPRI